MKHFLLMAPWALVIVLGCGSGESAATDTGAPAADGGQNVGCTSISCNVPAESLCDDYTMATATQCADVPAACANRAGTVANPSACPMAGFTAKCLMPGPGGYVLRFYGARGDANDQAFCTGTAGGTWSTTF